MDDISMRKAKGRILSGFAKYIKKRWGEGGIAAAEKRSGLNLKDIHDDAWYPLYQIDKISEWMVETHGLDACRQAGYSAVAERGLISFAARLAGINKVLDRGVDDFRDSFNFGEVNIRREGNKATITLKDVSNSEQSCMVWLGAFEGILKLTGKTGSVKETDCHFKGADSCVYELNWD